MNSSPNAAIGTPPFGLSRRAYVYGLAGVKGGTLVFALLMAKELERRRRT